MLQYLRKNHSLLKPAIAILVLVLLVPLCRAEEIRESKSQSISNGDLLAALQSTREERAHEAVVEIVGRGEVMIPLLLRCKGNKKYFYGYGLGHPDSSFLRPLPTGNRKADEGRVLTIEVAALYLVSAIFYQSLEFSQGPYLTDGSPVKRQRFNTQQRVSKAWRGVEKWHARLKMEGIDSLRKRKASPLRDSGVHFWGTSD